MARKRKKKVYDINNIDPKIGGIGSLVNQGSKIVNNTITEKTITEESSDYYLQDKDYLKQEITIYKYNNIKRGSRFVRFPALF